MAAILEESADDKGPIWNMETAPFAVHVIGLSSEDGKSFEIFEQDKINTTNTHGAGCTFSAAIAAQLAKGADVREAVFSAKTFVTEAIRRSFTLNRFVGTLDHGAHKRSEG